MSTLISRYLFMYRNTPHWTTNESPLKLMFGRVIRTRLDFLRTHRDRQTQLENKKGRTRLYKVGDTVYTKDYINSNLLFTSNLLDIVDQT